MRTTVDLPDELFRRAKARAALQGRTFKELLEECVRKALDEEPEAHRPARRRSPLPFISKAATGAIPAYTNAEIAEILDEEDADRANRSAGY